MRDEDRRLLHPIESEPMDQVLIRGGTVIPVDPSLPESFVGDVMYSPESGTIIAVAPTIEPLEIAEVVDARGLLVMPGLVDSHRHPWQILLRNLSTDQTVIQYRSGPRAEAGQRYEPDDVYAATLLSDLEAINSGVTTVADLAHIMNTPEHADAAIEAHRASGQRILFAHGAPNDAAAASWWSQSDRSHPDDIRRLRAEVLTDDDALVRLGMFVRPPFLVKPDVLAHDFDLARELDLHLSMDGGVGGGCWGASRWGDPGLRPVTDIERIGGLGPRLTLVHCNNLDSDELDLIARSGTNVSISPDHEMNCGHGLPATKNLVDHGIEPGLSIDSTIAVSGDMFSAMRSLLTSTRGAWSDRAYAGGYNIDTWRITTRDVLRFATLRSAAAVGLADQVGSLTPGKKADIVLLKSDPLNLTLLNDPVASIVTTAHPGNVDTVIVGGSVRKRDGRLIDPGVPRVIALAEAARHRVLAAIDHRHETGLQQWSMFA